MTTHSANPGTQSIDQEENKQLWRMRWCFIAILTTWIIVAVAGTILIFWMTRNPFSFTLFSTLAPPVYFSYRFTNYLFPMSERDFKLESIKVQQKIEKKSTKLGP